MDFHPYGWAASPWELKMVAGGTLSVIAIHGLKLGLGGKDACRFLIVKRYRLFSDNEFLHGEDSFLLTPANIESGDHQLSRDPSLKFILGYPITAEQIEGLSCSPYATVYSPATTNPRDFGLVIHLKDKVYLDGAGEKKHGVKKIILETDVLTVVRVVRFLRMSGQN
jgi:hypothetical protein